MVTFLHPFAVAARCPRLAPAVEDDAPRAVVVSRARARRRRRKTSDGFEPPFAAMAGDGDEDANRDGEKEREEDLMELDHDADAAHANPTTGTTTRDGDDSDDDDDQSDSDDGYGSDLMGDANDRAALAAMNELERETIMLERAEARKKRESRKRIMALAKSKELEMARKKTGGRAVSSGKRDELEALEKIAEAKRRKERGKRVFGDLTDSDEEEEYYDEEEDLEEERGAVPRPSKKPTSTRRRRGVDVDEEAEYLASDLPASREDVESITLKRHQLEAWVNEPYFESAITNCCVRVGIGLNKQNENVYRLVEIAGVADGKYKQYSLKKYEYLAGKPPTSKWLILRWGKSEKTFRLSEVSNSSVSDAEWAAWVAHCRASECRPVYKKDVDACLANLKEAQNYRYTADDVTKILAQKREKLGARHNLMFEKEQIKAAIAHAEAEADFEQVSELRARLDELDREIKAKLQARLGATQDALANINRRNEIQNSEKLSKRASEQVARLKAGIMNTGESDPFSRRPTRLTTYWDMGASAKGGEDPAAAAAAAAAAAKDDAAKDDTAEKGADEDDEDDVFLTAGMNAQQSEKELVGVLRQAHKDNAGAIKLDLNALTNAAVPADAIIRAAKTTQSFLQRGAASLRSAYDARRAEERLDERPPGKTFSVDEYLRAFG